MTTPTFLDDKLYAIVKATEIKSPADFSNLTQQLYDCCENHWRATIDANTPTDEFKAGLDRTFKSWDSFITKLKKEEYFLCDMVEKYSYKSAFMGNPKLKEAYGKL